MSRQVPECHQTHKPSMADEPVPAGDAPDRSHRKAQHQEHEAPPAEPVQDLLDRVRSQSIAQEIGREPGSRESRPDPREKANGRAADPTAVQKSLLRSMPAYRFATCSP